MNYFNNKKGRYWSKRETQFLVEALLRYKVTDFNGIKTYEPPSTSATDDEVKPFHNFSVTEIRLRICKQLKVYDLSVYKDKLFQSVEEI